MFLPENQFNYRGAHCTPFCHTCCGKLDPSSGYSYTAQSDSMLGRWIARPPIQCRSCPCRWALLCQLASWFNAYCLVRTVSNSLEALASVAALYHLWCYRAAPGAAAAKRQLRIAVAAAAAGVVIRPPSLLFWLLPGVWRHCHLPAGLQSIRGSSFAAACTSVVHTPAQNGVVASPAVRMATQ